MITFFFAVDHFCSLTTQGCKCGVQEGRFNEGKVENRESSPRLSLMQIQHNFEAEYRSKTSLLYATFTGTAFK